MSTKELVIVIPAYEPNHLLIDLINKLNNYFNDFSMIVVNDGSLKSDSIFEEAKDLPNVVLINHEVNKGKGEALKTAFNYIKDMGGEHVIVTADSDGQHKPEDIYRVWKFYKKYNKGLVLGSRKFEGEIPARSTFGNNVARILLKMCNGKHLNDTQTGLRAFGSELLDFMLDVNGSRYEYEMNMLSECARTDIDINEIAIATIYINNNEGSHFRPVRDFSRICSVILKYSLPFIVSIIVNAILFGVYFMMFDKLSIESLYKLIYTSLSASATTFVINMLFNALGVFFGNKNIFKNKIRFGKYIGISLFLIAADLLLTYLFNNLINNIGLAKLISTSILFIVVVIFSYLLPKLSVLHEE